MKNHYLHSLTLLFIGLLLPVSVAFCGADNTANNPQQRGWQDILVLNNPDAAPFPLPDAYRTVVMNPESIRRLLQNAPLEFSTQARINSNLPRLVLPLPQGGQCVFAMAESPVMEPELAAQFPDIKTYKGHAADASGRVMRLTVSASGIHVVVLSEQGLWVIEPMKGSFEPNTHLVYFDTQLPDADILCGLIDDPHFAQPYPDDNYRGTCGGNGGTLRTYRIAIAATGELTTQYGGVAATTDFIVATLNGITLVFEQELSVHLSLIAGNSSLIFTNPATDPFDPNAANLPNNAQSGISTVLNNSQYDIGHVLHYSTSSNSGIAWLSAVCVNGNKGKGWSSIFSLAFSKWVLLVAHEFGHQFGASHSFYGTEGFCNQRSTSSAYEPGSGTTIMSYQGICGTQNIGSAREGYFHAISLQQMLSFINTTATCNTSLSTGNTPPVGNANPTAGSYTIPIQTPFELTGTAFDADADAVTYCWEEFDTDGSAGDAPNNAANSTTAPLFRSFLPTTNPTRTFPQLTDILNNTQTIGEILPAIARSINFRLTVRDNNPNGGAIDCDATSVTVSAVGGPFSITSQNTATTWVANGSNTATVTWNVANTTAAPISCANVNLLFSADGGQTFPYILAANTPNDGTHTFTIPSYPTAAGRVKVAASGNIFFDINNAPITLTSSCAANAASIIPTTAVSATAGSPALDLNLLPNYGSAIANFSGSISSTDPDSFLPANNGLGVCTSFAGNATKYDVYNFKVNISGNYTFTRTGPSGVVMHAYNGPFNPGSPCTNWIASSYNSATTIISSSLTLSLSTNVLYTFVVASFSASNPVLPANYTINFTPPGGGGLYNGTPPPPGVGYAYTYIIVNNSTGIITGVNGSSDLSDALKYTPAVYSVYGFSYQSATLPNNLILEGTNFQTLQNDLALLVYCGSLSTNSVSVTVLPVSCTPPAAPTISPPASTNICISGIMLTASAIPGGFVGYAYQWYKDGILIGAANAQTYTATSSGTYTVLLSNGACPSAQSGGVVLTQVPPPALAISPLNTTLCQGNSQLLSATAIDAQYPNHIYRWFKDGVLLPGQNAQTLTATQAGSYTVQAYLTDACSATSVAATITLLPLTAVPNLQNFTAGVPPSGWSISNPDAATTWASQTTACYGASAFISNFTYNNPGQEDVLRSPLYDLSPYTSASLTFDVAYARYDAFYADGLQVQVSDDCGQTYTTLYNKSSSDLATAPDITTAFTPTDCSQWRTETIDLSAYAGSPILLRFVAINGFGNNLYLDNINLSGNVAAGVRIEAKVWLEGAYNTVNNNLNTLLRLNNHLPLAQPYNRPPWNYAGTETALALPANITDWVLLDVLDAGNTLIARKAALLRNDGILLNPDGTTGVLFSTGVVNGNTYYLLIRHRNHVAAAAANGIVVPNTNNPYNFTLPANVQGGASQLTNVGSGNYALIAADANANGIINYTDANLYFTQNLFSAGYYDADFNLDGSVTGADFDFYSTNSGVIGVSLVRY